MKISVLVTAYNFAGFVEDAVESALAQQPAPTQVVVVDDGSTDGSPALLRERYGAHPSVRLLLQPNRGQLAAIAAGAALCDGDVVAMLDGDDRYEPGYLAALERAYAARPRVDFVFCDMLFSGRTGRFSETRGAEKCSRYIGHSGLQVYFDKYCTGSMTSATSLRRSLLVRVVALPADLLEDWRICGDVAVTFGSSILGAAKYYLHEAHVTHRWHGRNATAFYNQQSLTPADRMLWEMKQWRLIAHYGAMMGYTPDHLGFAKNEFKSRDHTSWSEAREYIGLAWRAPRSVWSRIEHCGSILKHYWKTGGQPRRRPTRQP